MIQSKDYTLKIKTGQNCNQFKINRITKVRKQCNLVEHLVNYRFVPGKYYVEFAEVCGNKNILFCSTVDDRWIAYKNSINQSIKQLIVVCFHKFRVLEILPLFDVWSIHPLLLAVHYRSSSAVLVGDLGCIFISYLHDNSLSTRLDVSRCNLRMDTPRRFERELFTSASIQVW